MARVHFVCKELRRINADIMPMLLKIQYQVGMNVDESRKLVLTKCLKVGVEANQAEMG